jgi:hypothetical protein
MARWSTVYVMQSNVEGHRNATCAAKRPPDVVFPRKPTSQRACSCTPRTNDFERQAVFVGEEFRTLLVPYGNRSFTVGRGVISFTKANVPVEIEIEFGIRHRSRKN